MNFQSKFKNAALESEIRRLRQIIGAMNSLSKHQSIVNTLKCDCGKSLFLYYENNIVKLWCGCKS